MTRSARQTVAGVRRSAFWLGSLLSLSCALIDPLDAVPEGHSSLSSTGGTGSVGGMSQAMGGRSSAGDRSSAGGMSPAAGSTGTTTGGSAAGFASTANQAGASGGGAGPGSCKTNADCESNSRCLPEHVCVRLDTGECPKVIGGELANDPNAIFIGAFAPLAESSKEALTIPAIYEMAAQEFNDLGGLRGIAGSRPSPLVAIVCDNHTINAAQAFHHLIDVVKVPAVLAAMVPNDLLAGFNQYPSTFFISAVQVSRELASVSDGRAWTMVGQPSDLADVYQALMPHAEGLVRAALPTAEIARDIRVAVVTEEGNDPEQELFDAVLPLLKFNGKTAAEQLGANFFSKELKSDASNLNDVVDTLYADAQKPDIVFSFAKDVFTAPYGVMHRLNTKYWPNQRPVYVLSPQNAVTGAAVTAELSGIWQNVDHKNNAARVLGVDLAGVSPDTAATFNSFAVRFHNEFPSLDADFSNYYDAFYFLAYAAYAGPRQAFFTGLIQPADFSGGMLKLTNLGAKMKYAVGPNDISSIFTALNGPNAMLELDGTVGRPDFERRSGIRRNPGSLYCFDSTVDFAMHKDVLTYDRETQSFTSVDHPLCLINFQNQ